MHVEDAAKHDDFMVYLFTNGEVQITRDGGVYSLLSEQEAKSVCQILDKNDV